MVPSYCRYAAVVLLACLASTPGHALQFYLRSGSENQRRRCFSDSAPPGARVMGEYTVAAGHGEMAIDIDVRNAENTQRFFYKQNIAHGKFAFVVPVHAKDAPRVEHAEMHRKHGESHGHHGHEHEHQHHSRRLLSVDDDRHGGHHDDDDEDDDWDMDDYEGLNEDALDIEGRKAADEMQAEHDAHFPHHGDFHGHRYDDDAAMDDHDIDQVFEERKFHICVEARGGAGVQQRRVRLILHKGESAKDMHRLAKKEHMTSLEASLRGISSELHDLMHELEHAHQMEEGLRAINQKTNRAVVNYATVSIVAMAVVGFFQARYTRGYLKTKKIS